MCGITGWVDWNADLRNQTLIVKKMAETLEKRGPDVTNTWCHEKAAFGHTRLIVIDPVGGVQPMQKTVGDRTYTLIYNGELYNTSELRQILLSCGHTFTTQSDTEVLLCSYIEWGSHCLERLNGIFAFAIWNEKEQSLFMARDRLGVKPLFYSEKKESLIFGSEIKALLQHPEVEPKVDREGLAEIFGLGPSRTPGHGIFKGIKELRPAHALTFNRKGLRIYRYWQVHSKEHKDNTEETVEKVRHLFQHAVHRQLVADVPVGTFLSGGVDSSAISAYAADYFKKRGQTLQTYSIDYENNDQFFTSNDFQPDADGPWIQKMSEYLGSKHHSFVIPTDQLVHYLKEAVIVRDQPGMADIDSSLLWFCKKIKGLTTVALSGECADEIFGGYPWFHRQELMDRKSFPWMTSILERQRLLLPEWQKKLQLEKYVQSRYEQTLQEVPRLEGESPQNSRRREIFYLNMIWFMTTLLDRKDRMSMGASLEVRVPFADHHLVEYVWNIPWEMKMYENREKGIFRKAMEGMLPKEILYRKKSPYPKTFHPNYTQAVQKGLLEIISRSDAALMNFVNKDVLEDIIHTQGKAFKRPWFGQLMTGPQLMAHLIQINIWLETYNIKISD